MLEFEKTAHALRDKHRIASAVGKQMSAAQAMYHAFTYCRAMVGLVDQANVALGDVDVSFSEHLLVRVPALRAALKDVAAHARAFGESEDLDGLLKSKPRKAGASPHSLEVLEGFVRQAHPILQSVAQGNPSTVLLPSEERVPKVVFDLVADPYLAAIDYVEYFQVDVAALVEYLRPEDDY